VILPSDSIRGRLDLRADVCVVGSGIGGAVCAAGLGAQGLSVVMLEEGGDPAPASSEIEGRAGRMRDQGLQATADRGVVAIQGRLLGGSAELGDGGLWRVPEPVLRGWAATRGIDRFEPGAMESGYDAVESELAPRVDRSLCGAALALVRGAEGLGWRTSTVPRPRTRGDECSRCGRCWLGCPTGARRSPRSVWVPRASAAGVKVLCGCRADRLDHDAGRVRGVLGVAFEGGAARHRIRVRADAVVLAAGAVHTPALMLTTRIHDPHRQIGAGFRVQPTAPLIALFDEPLGGDGQGHAAVTEFLGGSQDDGTLIATTRWPAGSLASYIPLRRDSLREMVDHRSLAQIAVTIADRRCGWVVPLATGRPVLRYELAPPDRRRLAAGIRRASRALLHAGAREVVTSHAVLTRMTTPGDVDILERRRYRACDLALYSTSAVGTAAMGEDPRTSVTDGHGRVHGIEGLYVADASLLPGAPCVPAGLTVAVLARAVGQTVAEDLG